jgi:CHAD domain-containing protein
VEAEPPLCIDLRRIVTPTPGTSVFHEVECTYAVDEDTAVPDLAGVGQVASMERIAEVELEATYFDTSDLALAASGVTLRRRQGGEDEGWHLKLPASAGRHEVQLPLGRAVKTVPKPLRVTVDGLARGRRLTPVAVVRNRREIYALLDAAGGVLAHLCDDHVSATATATATTEERTATWREWEVELVDGAASLLQRVTATLADQGVTPAPLPSKLGRTLGVEIPDGSPVATPRLRRKAPAGRVVQARLREQVAELRRQEPLARGDLPEGIHAMRVTVRRLRSALATYRKLLDASQTDPIRDELRWLGDTLGAARDAEVMRHRLTRTLLGESIAVGGLAARMDAELGLTYRDAHARCVEALDSDRHIALVERLQDLADDPPLSKQARRPAQQAIRRCVRSEWRRLARRVAASDQAETAEERAIRLHDVRKAAKRFRYAVEAVAPIYGKDAKQTIKAARLLQDDLGEYHDSVLAQDELRRLADRFERPADVFACGVLTAREQIRAAEAEARFRRSWKQASKPRLRRWLG